jgi:hypothetical protein
MRKQILMLILISSGLAACSKGSKKPSAGPVEPGQMYEAAVKNISTDIKNDCDDRDREKMLYVTKKFDSMADTYQRIVSEMKSKKSNDSYSLGPILVRRFSDYKEKSKWQKNESGWSEIYDTLSKGDSLPDTTFIRLAGKASRMLDNDEYRRFDYWNMFIRPQSLDLYDSAVSKVDSCISQSACAGGVRLTQSEEKELRLYWFFAKRLDEVRDSKDFSQAKAPLERLSRNIHVYLDHYKFTVNDSVSRSKDGVLELPLDIGDLKGLETEIETIIESAWKSKNLSIDVRWTTQAQEAKSYRFIFDGASKKPARVSDKKRTIFIPSVIRDQTIAHEIGHVLGFADHYFEFFNEKTCVYESWYRDDDLMSGANKVLIPAFRWDELNRSYPQL